MKSIKSMVSFLLMVTAGLMTLSAYAGTPGKPNVFIDYFWRDLDVPFSCAEQLRSNVIEGINKTNRVELIDVDSREALMIERERRENGVDPGDDIERLKVMVEEGADYIINGRISSLAVKEHRTEKGSRTYTVAIAYTIKVIDPNTGKLVYTKNLKHECPKDPILGISICSHTTPDDGVTHVCGKAVKGMMPVIQEVFPLIGTFLEVDKVNKDKVESMYMRLGSASGVSRRDRFDVCIERIIGGEKSEKKIGEVEVDAVEGVNISHVKVKSGHREIKSAIDGGQTIVFKSESR